MKRNTQTHNSTKSQETGVSARLQALPGFEPPTPRVKRSIDHLRRCKGYSKACEKRTCGRCRRGAYDRRRRTVSFTCPYGAQSATIAEAAQAQASFNVRGDTAADHRRGRVAIRAKMGVWVGQDRGCRIRIFVLTESDESLAAGKDFGQEWHRFVTWLRKSGGCPDFQYAVIVHAQGVPSKVTGQRRHNYHILSHGSDRLPLEKIKAYWKAHYLSTVTGMEEVRDPYRMVSYLAGYLTRGDKLVRAFYSHGWVYPRWVFETKRVKDAQAHYPSVDDTRALAAMSPSEREFELDYLRETGSLSSFFEPQLRQAHLSKARASPT